MYFAKEARIIEPLKLSKSLMIIIFSSLIMILAICLLPEKFLMLATSSVKLLVGSFHAL